MKTNQAWGWLAAGVLAAGLNASYYDGGLQWAHRIADRVGDRSETALAVASGRASLFLAEARMIMARDQSASCPWSRAAARAQSRIARSQSQFDRFEAMSERQQAQLARLEANRDRMEAQITARAARFRVATAAFSPATSKAMALPVVCPRVRVNIPELPIGEMPVVPEVHVDLSSAGPV
jgi:hypothetical protein